METAYFSFKGAGYRYFPSTGYLENHIESTDFIMAVDARAADIDGD